MAFRKIVGSYKDYTLSSHIIEAGYLAVDTITGDLRIGDGVTAGGTLIAAGTGVTGNVTFYGTKLVSPSNGPIELVPGGTGSVLTPSIDINDNEITARNSNEDLILTGSGTGKVQLSGLAYPTSDGSDGQFLKTDGSGVLSFASVSVGDFSFVGSSIISPSNADITLDPSGSGAIALNANTTITGNLTVTGTQTTLETTTLVVEDPLLELAKNNSGGIANTMDQGLFFNRGSLSNVSLIWDESADEFATAVTAGEDGTTSGNITIDSYAGLQVGVLKGTTGTFSSTLAGTTGTFSSTLAVTGEATFTGGIITGALTTNTISSNGSNADISIQPSGTGDVVISELRINGTTLDSSDSSAININEGLIVDGTLIASGALTASGLAYPTSDGDAGQFLKTNGSGTLSFATVSIGDLSIVGATIAAPSNAPLTLVSSGSSVNIEGLSVAGNVISTTDSSSGVEITGNLIPSADGIYQLGSTSRRWQTAYLSAETLDIGGATISSDGTGSISIAATGATLPSGSKVGTQTLMLGGKTSGSSGRPVQLVEIFVSDGSTVRTDAQILALDSDLELEFNGTVDDTPVYTEAQQTFTLTSGATLASNQTGITLFQF